VLSGGLGDDVLIGGPGNDTIDSGDGDDTEIQSLGADTVTSATAADQQWLAANARTCSSCWRQPGSRPGGKPPRRGGKPTSGVRLSSLPPARPRRKHRGDHSQKPKEDRWN
jgi:hypothetical protein